MPAGKTAIIIGSSGVGKSTLINSLIGDLKQETKEVRASDSRGMHTTTNREMFLLPSGGLLFNTPGIRKLQPSGSYHKTLTLGIANRANASKKAIYNCMEVKKGCSPLLS